MTSSINTNIAAFYAQANIAAASNSATSSVARLSSGNRIVQASDDVAALATGTSLQSQVSALKAAQTNAAQGTSLLQVADGALAQIGNILQQQQSLALQAGAGSLTDTDRGFLNEQFQALSTEINTLASSTTFNGVNLVDGSLSSTTAIKSNTGTSAASAVTAKILTDSSTDFVAGDTLTINGYTVTFAANNAPVAGDVTVGTGANAKNDTIANLAAFLNSSGAPQLANLQFVQNSSTKTELDAVYSGGALGAALSITTKLGASDTGAPVLAGTSGVTTIGSAGTSNGLGVDRTSAVGTVTGAVLANGGTLDTTVGSAIDVTNISNSSSFLGALGGANIGAITAGTYAPHTDDATSGAASLSVSKNSNLWTYTFKTAGEAAKYQAGDTFSFNGATGTINTFDVSTLDAHEVVTAVNSGTNTITFAATVGGSAVGNINSTAAGALTTGTISQDDQANFTVVAGNITYTSSNVGISSTYGNTAGKFTAPIALTFTGKNTVTGVATGGSFTVNVATNGGITTGSINSQSSLAAAAAQINSALGGITFQQNRDLSSFSNVGSNILLDTSGNQISNLTGTTANLNTGDYSTAATNITGITVSAPVAGSANTDAVITANIGGDTYTSLSGIGNKFAVNSQIILKDTANPTKSLTFTLGSAGITGQATTALDLSTASNAAAVQAALSKAFGISAGLSFQLGSAANSVVGVNVGGATTSILFNGANLDISSKADATTANTVVANAINTVTAIRANVGALESQFTYASAALQTSVQNQDAARGQFLDTDIATESTSYATSQVKLQAGISVLAQANQSLQALLKLIQ